MANHEWESPDLSTCKKCGDKDWMADAECSESKLVESTAKVGRGFTCPYCQKEDCDIGHDCC